MVNVQGIADSLLLLAALLAGVVITYSYFASQGVIEFGRVANVKSFLTLPCKVDAVRAIDFAVTPIYKTFRFAYGCAASPSTKNGNGIVMPVVFALPPLVFCRPLTLTFLITKVMHHALNVPTRSIKYLAAIFTGDILPTLFWLHFCMMVANKLSLTSSPVVFFERFPASTSAFYHGVIHD